MFQRLVSHNPDLARLIERGFAVAFNSNNLVIREIPYLGEHCELKWGAIATKLVFADENHVEQEDHQVWFAGTHPHELDGTAIANLGGGLAGLQLTDACSDVVVERSFSNKPMPAGRFSDFFEKIESYVSIISGPAMELHGVTPYTFRINETAEADPIFKFQDTLTSRAQIGDLNKGLANDVVAVIGLGGTGAYLLDLLLRSRVPVIRGFDGDRYHVHTAFRSPGRVDADEFRQKKAEVYATRYANFRNGLHIEPVHIDASTADRLEGVTFAFVCVDKGSSRAGIFDVLIDRGIPFIDVGMGLNRKHGPINGQMRVTYYSVDDAIEMRARGLAELSDVPDDIYPANIQIGELNALNACLALIRYKQLRGFYRDEASFRHLLFGIGDLHITGDADFDHVPA